jgi:two-component system response regulator FixJ
MSWKIPMIFIVDDDYAARDSLRILLECKGFEAQEFASGRAFLDAGPPADGDCLIIDMHMPGMSGLELLERLRRNGYMLPSILITGSLDAATLNRARAAGVPRVVEKPYQVEDILDQVRLALGRGC